MTRTSSFLTLAALVLAAPLAGQSQSAPATARVVIKPSLSLVNIAGLDFGEFPASIGELKSGGGNVARWSGATDHNTEIILEFDLPPELTSAAGGPGVPIKYGATSAAVEVGEGGPALTFIRNPAAPFSVLVSNSTGSGAFLVYLGREHGNGDEDLVRVSLADRPAGTYQATIMLTVTVL